MFMCRYCNTMTMHHATKSLCGECVHVWVSKWAAQLKTILVAKWEVPVSKRERLPKRVVTVIHRMTHWLQMWALPEMSRIRRPCLMSCRTLLRDRHHPPCHDKCRSHHLRLSPTLRTISQVVLFLSCPSLVAGPGGPISLGALVIVASLLRGWLCFP